jgi:glycerol-3-phosphate acyltransferase PlsY
MSVYVLVVCIAGYSSLGSLAAATIMPLTIWKASHSMPLTVCATIMAVFIFARHRDNIKRLLAGQEDSVFEMH